MSSKIDRVCVCTGEAFDAGHLPPSGHALISDALELGMAEATQRHLAICRG
jgi:hypothetical protein